MDDLGQLHAALAEGLAVQENRRHGHHLAPRDFVLKHRTIDHGVANLRIERGHGVQRLHHVRTALTGQRHKGLEVEIAVQSADLLDDGIVDFRRIAAGLQQCQHQGSEFMSHRHARKADLGLCAGTTQGK